MAGDPARNRYVRCAVSQSGRATYPMSRRNSATAITSATLITARLPSLPANIMRWHHDKPKDDNCIESPGRGSLCRRRASICARRSQDGASQVLPLEELIPYGGSALPKPVKRGALPIAFRIPARPTARSTLSTTRCRTPGPLQFFDFPAKDFCSRKGPHNGVKAVSVLTTPPPLPLRNARKIQARERQTARSSWISLLDEPLAVSAMVSGDP